MLCCYAVSSLKLPLVSRSSSNLVSSLHLQGFKKEETVALNLRLCGGMGGKQQERKERKEQRQRQEALSIQAAPKPQERKERHREPAPAPDMTDLSTLSLNARNSLAVAESNAKANAVRLICGGGVSVQ